MPKVDLVVTTPRSEIQTAAEEARMCIENNGGFYFRTFRVKPKHLHPGTRIFYVEDGYLRGFGIVSEISHGEMECEITGKIRNGWHAIIPADSWKWIRPIPWKGFQGFRYFNADNIKIVGGWKDPKPKI